MTVASQKLLCFTVALRNPLKPGVTDFEFFWGWGGMQSHEAQVPKDGAVTEGAVTEGAVTKVTPAWIWEVSLS